MKISPLALAATALLSGSTNAFVPIHSTSSLSLQVGRTPLTTESLTSTQLGVFRIFGSSTNNVDDKTSLSTKNGGMPTLEKEEVKDLFYLWNDALKTLEPEIVASRYSDEAILLPTVSDTPRTDKEGIVDYFTKFLKLEPQGEILLSQVYAWPGMAKDAGIYEFTMGTTGKRVKARYSFVYIYEQNQWKILHHHSSQMPEEVTANDAPKLNKEQVQNLFFLWNDALDTLDASAVASLYAKNAVLLPTVSDKPRTDSASIRDYFEAFLQLKPQGTILESYVEYGANWAKDVGIYEFVMRADNNRKVKARYTFLYTFEDGQWKIVHQHSSMMPEEQIKNSQVVNAGMNIPTEMQVRALFTKWNDALATLDSNNVAACFSKNAVLLPTVSDKPRTTLKDIQSYFDDFLLMKPQGVILDSFVEVGNGWAKDCGIYEFTLGSSGKKVKARYTFMYTFEDGEWKISHQHSSAMPEDLMAKAAKLETLEKESKKKGLLRRILG